MLMEIIIDKGGLICREDGVEDQQNGGMVNLEDAVIELLSRDKSFYRSWMSHNNI